MRVYRFIDSQRTDFDVKTLCRVCKVSRSSYYDWAAGPDAAIIEEAYLANRIYDIWRDPGAVTASHGWRPSSGGRG